MQKVGLTVGIELEGTDEVSLKKKENKQQKSYIFSCVFENKNNITSVCVKSKAHG